MSLAKVRRIHAHARRFTMYFLLLAAAALTLGATSATALPVIPGAAGFGMSTSAGRGGKVYRVTNLKADGAGSLKACASDGKERRVCVFEVSGIIRLTDDLIIRFPYLTIAGQTAPSPGIMIRGAAIRIVTSNVLVQHIRVRPGDDWNGPDPDNRDALKIGGTSAAPATNIVIDHCSFSWSVDEIASAWGYYDNITWSNNIFAEGLNRSIHRDSSGNYVRHGFGPILGSTSTGGRVTMVGNLIAHFVERNPLSRARQLVFVNNLVYDRANIDYDGQSEHYRITKTSLVGNVFLRGPSYERLVHPILLRTQGTGVLSTDARVYVYDNYAPENGSTLTSLVTYNGGHAISGMVSTSGAPVWNSGLTAQKTAGSAVYNRVLTYSGARPTDRDSVDTRIIKSVRERTGRIINCVVDNGENRCNENAGGWPYYAQHTRRLTLPSSPNSVASNGYTRLENWLHTMDTSLQGTTSSSSPESPASVSVR